MSQHTIAISTVLAFGLCGASAMAMPPDPADAPTPPVPGPASPVSIGGYPLEGQVRQMLINPYGEVDGLRLGDGTIARFPPHLSASLTSLVKVGDTVRIIGRPEAAGTIRADAIVQTATGRTLYDQPPPLGEGRPLPPHLRAQRLEPLQAEGRVLMVLSGRRGETNGVILGDGTIVRFPPDSLRQSVQTGAPFAASGLGTRNAYGTALEAVSMGSALSALQPLYRSAP